MHDSIRDASVTPLMRLMKTVNLIGPCSKVHVDPKNVVTQLPGARLCDISFRPILSVKNTTTPPIPFTQLGIDFVVTPPIGHLPAYQVSIYNAVYPKQFGRRSAFDSEGETEAHAPGYDRLDQP